MPVTREPETLHAHVPTAANAAVVINNDRVVGTATRGAHGASWTRESHAARRNTPTPHFPTNLLGRGLALISASRCLRA